MSCERVVGLRSIDTGSGVELLSEVVTRWEGFKYANDDGREEKRSENGLKEDRILDLAKSRLLNPDFTIQDLTEYVALLIFSDPRFVLVAVATPKRIERSFLHFEIGRCVIIFGKQLPRPKMTMMHAV